MQSENSSQLSGLVNGYKGILVQRYVNYLDVPGPGSAGIKGDRISGEKNPNETYPQIYKIAFIYIYSIYIVGMGAPLTVRKSICS